jgi:hypothetical protein
MGRKYLSTIANPFGGGPVGIHPGGSIVRAANAIDDLLDGKRSGSKSPGGSMTGSRPFQPFPVLEAAPGSGPSFSPQPIPDCDLASSLTSTIPHVGFRAAESEGRKLRARRSSIRERADVRLWRMVLRNSAALRSPIGHVSCNGRQASHRSVTPSRSKLTGTASRARNLL